MTHFPGHYIAEFTGRKCAIVISHCFQEMRLALDVVTLRDGTSSGCGLLQGGADIFSWNDATELFGDSADGVLPVHLGPFPPRAEYEAGMIAWRNWLDTHRSAIERMFEGAG